MPQTEPRSKVLKPDTLSCLPIYQMFAEECVKNI